MRSLARVLVRFAFGCLAVGIALFAVKFAVVRWLGEGLYHLPELELERFAKVFAKKPVTDSSLVILGDSTGAFSVDALRLNDATSFAAVNSTSIEAYYVLRRILESGSRPKCALVSFSFIWERNRELFWPMFVAGGFYTHSELEEVLSVSRGFKEPPGAGPEWKIDLHRLAARSGLWDDMTVARLQYGLSSMAWEASRVRAFRESLWYHKGSTPLIDSSRFEGPLDLTYSAKPAVTQTEAHYFRRLLKLASDNGIKVYFNEVPFAESVPLEEDYAFWREYELLLARLTLGIPRTVRPWRVPAAEVISAGHLTDAGIRRISPYLNSGLADCHK